MGWLVAVGAGALLGLGALVGLGWLDWRATRRAADAWREAQRAGRASVLANRRPQDDLEGWR